MTANVQSVTLIVNGEQMRVPPGTTVSALLQLAKVEPAQIAVELDGKIVHREAWPETILSPGAAVEIVRFVGGG